MFLEVTRSENIKTAFEQAAIKLFANITSKKFITFIIATHMTYTLILDSQSWLLIAMLFMGVQGVLDWKNGNKTSGNSEPGSTSH